MGLEEITAIITIVPALAWFVGAFTKLFKMYRVNETKIKQVAHEQTEKIVTTAEQLKEKVEQEVDKKLHKAVNQNDPSTQSETEEGSQPH